MMKLLSKACIKSLTVVSGPKENMWGELICQQNRAEGTYAQAFPPKDVHFRRPENTKLTLRRASKHGLSPLPEGCKELIHQAPHTRASRQPETPMQNKKPESTSRNACCSWTDGKKWGSVVLLPRTRLKRTPIPAAAQGTCTRSTPGARAAPQAPCWLCSHH